MPQIRSYAKNRILFSNRIPCLRPFLMLAIVFKVKIVLYAYVKIRILRRNRKTTLSHPCNTIWVMKNNFRSCNNNNNNGQQQQQKNYLISLVTLIISFKQASKGMPLHLKIGFWRRKEGLHYSNTSWHARLNKSYDQTAKWGFNWRQHRVIWRYISLSESITG